jgi:hypothetical protein
MSTAAPAPARRVIQSSELSRHSADVFAKAEEGAIEVTRRDGEPLVLLTKREDDERELVLEIAAQLIAVSIDDRGTLVDRLAGPFPWIKLLSDRDQEQCANDIIQVARGAFSIGLPARLLTEVAAWRNTAEAVAMGVANEPLEWVGEFVSAERP